MKKFKSLIAIFFLVGILITPYSTQVAATGTDEQIIVIFKNSINHELIKKVQGTVQYEYEAIHAVAMTVQTSQIPILEKDESVLTIQKDQSIQVENEQVTWGNLKTKAEESKKVGLTGKGTKIAILDTGADPTHPDLNLVGGECLLDYCPHSFSDDNGHGTHVAGIIGAQKNSIGIAGIVPDATIYAIKVLDDDGFGSTSTVMAGIDWAIQHDIDIINLSLSTPKSDLALKMMLDKAYQAGLLIVSAAGNDGTIDGLENTVEYPAKYASVIAVASLNQANTRLESSASGAEIEIAAPGEYIYSTIPKMFDDDGQRDGYTWMSGTSMAAPFVTGILAQYKQQFPEKTNAELRKMLWEHAADLGNPGRDYWYGYGLVQAIGLENPATMDVNVTVENGTVNLSISSLPDGATSYNIYRDGTLIAENLTNLTFHDYLLKGIYHYQFSVVQADGQESRLTVPTEVEVAEPYYKDLLNSTWYTPELIYLSSKSILSGFNDNTIRPNQLVTRAEAVAMMGRAVGLDGTKRKTHFSDVNPESFAAGYIQSAYENNILKGFLDGTFHPDQPVTRAEMAILLSKAYTLQEAGAITFQDVTKNVTGHDAIAKVAGANITQGYPNGTFKPYEYMKRSEFAVFIARAENEAFR